MPNYNITVTEGYTPYTFDEMIKPLQIYKTEYDKMDAEIQDINDKASLASYYIDKEKDQDILRMHDAYMQDLSALADSFVSGGMTAEKRAAAKRLRQRYGSEISNILVAAQERQKEIEEQRQALLKNPNLRFSRNAQDTGLNYYYKNPVRDPYTPYDLDDIYKKAALAATAVSSSYSPYLSLTDAYDPQGNRVEGFKMKTKITGPSDTSEYIMKDITSEGEYKGKYGNYKSARDSIIAVTGINSIQDSNLKAAVQNAIDSGFASGIQTKRDSEFVKTASETKTSSRTSSGKQKQQGDVTLETMPTGLTSRDLKTVNEAKKHLGVKASSEEENPDFGIRDLGLNEQNQRIKALGFDNPNYVAFSSSKLDDLWKEYQDAENFDYGILKKEEIQNPIISPIGAAWRGLKSVGRILERLQTSKGSGKELPGNYSYGPALEPVVDTGKISFRNEEEQKQHVLDSIKNEYEKELDKIFNLEGASEYFDKEGSKIPGLNLTQAIGLYYKDKLQNQDFNTDAYLYTNAPTDIENYFKSIITNIKEDDKKEISGVFDEKGNKVKKSKVIGEMTKEKSVVTPLVQEDESGSLKVGVNVNGDIYFIKGAQSINELEKVLNTTSTILRSNPAGIPSKEEGNIITITNGKPDSITTYKGEEAIEVDKELDKYYSIGIGRDETGQVGIFDDDGVLEYCNSVEEAETRLPVVKAMYLAEFIQDYADYIPGVKNTFAFRLQGKEGIVNYVIMNGQVLSASDETRGDIKQLNKDISEAYFSGLKNIQVLNAKK